MIIVPIKEGDNIEILVADANTFAIFLGAWRKRGKECFRSFLEWDSWWQSLLTFSSRASCKMPC